MQLQRTESANIVDGGGKHSFDGSRPS